MPSDDGASWPPTDIPGMLAQVRADPDSPYWELLRRQVLAFAGAYGSRHGNAHDDPDDIAQEVMAILATPGKLEAFGHPRAPVEDHAPPGEPHLILQRAFLAWLAQVTRRVWQGRNRYWQARIEGRGSIQPLGPAPEEEAEDPADPSAEVPEQVLRALVLEAVWARLKELQHQSRRDAVKVLHFVLSAIQDVPHREIAQQFGCTQLQVGHSVFSIRRQLVKQLQRQLGPTVSAAVRPRPAGPGTQRAPRRRGTTGTRGKRPIKRPAESAATTIHPIPRRSAR